MGWEAWLLAGVVGIGALVVAAAYLAEAVHNRRQSQRPAPAERGECAVPDCGDPAECWLDPDKFPGIEVCGFHSEWWDQVHGDGGPAAEADEHGCISSVVHESDEFGTAEMWAQVAEDRRRRAELACQPGGLASYVLDGTPRTEYLGNGAEIAAFWVRAGLNRYLNPNVIPEPDPSGEIA